MDKRFDIKIMRSKRDWVKLLKELLGQGPPAVSSNLDTAREMFELLRRGGCKSVVIENPYMDEDHRRCHARLHHLAQAELSKYCKRLHFFNCSVDESNLRNITDEIREHYMGMSVWRPTNSFPVGRTMLSQKGIVKHPIGRRWQSFITCCAEQTVNLAGNILTIKGAPFIQQDHMVAACATAAVWMAQYYMAKCFDEFSIHYSPEITDAATKYDISYGRAIPSEGLNNGQILQALRELGYDPISYDVVKTSVMVAGRYIYRLVESGIPVIVGLCECEPTDEDGEIEIAGHAITVFGHGLDRHVIPEMRSYSEYNQTDVSLHYVDASAYCVSFIVNDDAAGPYRWMELIKTADIDSNVLGRIYSSTNIIDRMLIFKEKLLQRGITVSAIFFKSNGSPDMIAGIDFLAAPLPTAITLPPREAQDKALAAFFFLSGVYLGILNNLQQFTVRTFLIESNKYKQYICRVTNSQSDFAWWIRSFYLPKWIWVTEISVHKKKQNFIGRQILASVLIDSSAPRDTLDFILMHLAGWVIPVESKQLNVVKLIQSIYEGGEQALYDSNFIEYTQYERL